MMALAAPMPNYIGRRAVNQRLSCRDAGGTAADAESAESAENAEKYGRANSVILCGSTMEINEITREIVDAAIKVHSELGPGLLESAYSACLAHELRKRGLKVSLQVELPIVYDGVVITPGYRVDQLVEDVVIVELKAMRKVPEVSEAQLLSYLKLSGRKVGLLINFHCRRLIDGIKRLVNGYTPPDSAA